MGWMCGDYDNAVCVSSIKLSLCKVNLSFESFFLHFRGKFVPRTCIFSRTLLHNENVVWENAEGRNNGSLLSTSLLQR